MRFMFKGILYGMAFVLTYFISNYGPMNDLFEGAGSLYHFVKAWVLFTLGFSGGFLLSKFRK